MYKDLMLTDYFTEVYGDVETILDEEKPETLDEAMDVLEKRYDEITGGISGSYDCNAYMAKEKVINELGMFVDAVEWFSVPTSQVGEWFLNEFWETMDVLIRQYIYAYAIDKMIEMWFDKENDD